MNRRGLALSIFAALTYTTASHAQTEWTYHRTSDGAHPTALEQEQLWLINRARSNPVAEGVWLSAETNPDVADGRNFFNVDINELQNQFAAIAAKPPAAFDLRLYEAARLHSEDQIQRDTQDHDQQFDRVRNAFDINGDFQIQPNEEQYYGTYEPFAYGSYRGNVFSYSRNSLYAHAGFNIDWGPGTWHGMQDPAGHRLAIMAVDGNYSNVGIAAVYENDPNTNVGEFVVTQNFASAQADGNTFHNKFIVGTVWDDLNGNGRYDVGEGISGVVVQPNVGTYYAVTSAGGGYAIPITTSGTANITFSGGGVTTETVTQSLGSTSVLLDHQPGVSGPRNAGSGNEDFFLVRDQLHQGGPYGNNYGTDQHQTSIIAEFENTGHDLSLSLTGFDVDTSTEIQVMLNGFHLAYLKRGRDLQESALNRFSITQDMQIDDLNTLEFRSLAGTWGINQVKLRTETGPEIPLTLGQKNVGEYGYKFGTNAHRTVVRATFNASGNHEVRVKADAFHNNRADKTAVYVNNQFIRYMAKGKAKKLFGSTAIVPANVIVPGQNTVEFRQMLRIGRKWGVTNIKVFEKP